MKSLYQYVKHNKVSHNRRILIIDDDLDTANGIKHIVESYGKSSCEIVNEPYEALLALSDRRYDFVFVDQKMPGLNGSSVLTMLDEYVGKDPIIVDTDRYTEPIPVVLMSGSDVELKSNYSLKNFNLIEILNKRNLLNFLSLNFAS